jgi:hypothetical protein
MLSRLLKTKTFWTGLAGVASGIALCCTGDIPQGLPLIVTGLGLIFIRDSISQLPQSTPPQDK